MDEHHAPGTVINFVFGLLYWNFAWYVSLFIVYIGINMISCIFLCYLHCSFFMYLCLTSTILVLFIVVVSFHVCVYTCMYTHLLIIFSCILTYFCLLFIFDYLLFDYCDVYFIIFVILFAFYVDMYVGMNKTFCFAFTCWHVFCFVWIDQSWCKCAHMSTCSCLWNR